MGPGQTVVGECALHQGADNQRLAQLVSSQLSRQPVPVTVAADSRLEAICALFKDRCETTVALADWAAKFYQDVTPDAAELAQHVTETIRPALQALAEKLGSCMWDKPSIAAAIKEVLTATGLKMPQLAMPVRVLALGTPQTPSLDAVLALFDRRTAITRLGRI